MSNENVQLDELAYLKDKCRKMNIPVKGNPSVETLRGLIQAKEEGTGGAAVVDEPAMSTMEAEAKRQREIELEATKLIRCQITCMNPDKRNQKGGIYAAGNRLTGTIKKYIPFSPASHPDGYHVPKILLDMLREKEYLVIHSTEDALGRVKVTKTRVKEFNIVELPPLTEEELKELAKVQAAKGGLQD